MLKIHGTRTAGPRRHSRALCREGRRENGAKIQCSRRPQQEAGETCGLGLVQDDVALRRDRHAAARLFRKLLRGPGEEPLRLVTDKLRSSAAAHRAVMPNVTHNTARDEKQPGRSLTPADPPTGTSNAGVQITRPSATLPVDPRYRQQSVPSRTSSAARCSLSAVSCPDVRFLATGRLRLIAKRTVDLVRRRLASSALA